MPLFVFAPSPCPPVRIRRHVGLANNRKQRLVVVSLKCDTSGLTPFRPPLTETRRQLD